MKPRFLVRRTLMLTSKIKEMCQVGEGDEVEGGGGAAIT